MVINAISLCLWCLLFVCVLVCLFFFIPNTLSLCFLYVPISFYYCHCVPSSLRLSLFLLIRWQLQPGDGGGEGGIYKWPTLLAQRAFPGTTIILLYKVFTFCSSSTFSVFLSDRKCKQWNKTTYSIHQVKIEMLLGKLLLTSLELLIMWFCSGKKYNVILLQMTKAGRSNVTMKNKRCMLSVKLMYIMLPQRIMANSVVTQVYS